MQVEHTFLNYFLGFSLGLGWALVVRYVGCRVQTYIEERLDAFGVLCRLLRELASILRASRNKMIYHDGECLL